MKKQKLVCIVGPTASGKSDLALELARVFDGEIIMADSRQVYKGLDIGSGKVQRDRFFGKDLIPEVLESTYFHRGVRYHLLDVAEPLPTKDKEGGQTFSVATYKKLAEEALTKITQRKKLPVVEGGTGFYVDALIYNAVPPEVPPNKPLRKKLEQYSPEELLDILEQFDPVRAENIEQENPRRLIRAIEIAKALGKVPKPPKKKKPYDTLLIGLSVPEEELLKRIEKRTTDRLKNGWIAEVRELIANGVYFSRIEEFGLGYRCISDYLQNKITEKELPDCVVRAEKNYAKRQMRWFKRDENIKWFSPENVDEIETVVSKWLKK